ncbi:hypothetical protein [Deinococcus ficus]|uniref:hypothetical protein n=1 Tax=Deinococcus ficus TaxID=317577 RepID=UPI000400D8AB|nr:hypothetical protein [Deinococcus ficus]
MRDVDDLDVTAPEREPRPAPVPLALTWEEVQEMLARANDCVVPAVPRDPERLH